MKTIAIHEESHKKVKKFCSEQDLSIAQFVEHSLNYFSKTKLNPKEDVLTIREEFHLMKRRLDQVIAFQRTFEKQNLIPLFQEIKKLNLEVESSLKDHSQKSSIIIKMIEEFQELIIQDIVQLDNSVKLLLQLNSKMNKEAKLRINNMFR